MRQGSDRVPSATTSLHARPGKPQSWLRRGAEIMARNRLPKTRAYSTVVDDEYLAKERLLKRV